MAVAALVLIAPSTAAGATAAPPAPPTFPTSLSAAGLTWAAIPMGRLGQPLNTFWELFSLAPSGQAWVNHAQGLGVATNGGLLLAAPGGSALVAATRPAYELRFTALSATTGSSWVPGTPLEGAASALAASPAGNLVAVVAGPGGGQLLEAASLRSSWRSVASAASLSVSPAGRRCDPRALSAVAVWPGGGPVVGARCGRPGTVGLFTDLAGRWQAIGPALPPADRRAGVTVLAAATSPAGLEVLLGFGEPEGREQLAVATRGPGGSWTLSRSLALRQGTHLTSVGPVPEGGMFALAAGGRAEHLALAQGDGRWSVLPSPPSGTATVAFPAVGRLDALVSAGSVMTDWVLGPRGQGWVRHGAVKVAILYGSSN